MTLAAAASIALFAALMLLVSLQLLAASGHFPASARTTQMQTPPAVAVLWLSVALTVAALIAGGMAAWHVAPWQGLVIGGGLAVLTAPLLLQPCPDWFVDGRAALATFSAGAILCAVLLVVTAGR